jgi:hypothetical protein
MKKLIPIVLASAAVALAGPAAALGSDTVPTASIASLHVKKDKKRGVHRRGGKVRAAWPRSKSARKPRDPIARWLAKQVGPVGAAKKAARHKKKGRLAHTSTASPTPLWLIRSFDVPATDPAYSRLANYSWTYDNALATFAFISVGLRSGAEQLLDQLQALQRTDGSLEYAFDTRTGADANHIRAGAIAWVGLAATAYRREYNNSRYDKLIGGSLAYLLSLRNSDGLVKGGPDVSWVSTQHNLLTVGFIRDLGAQLSGNQKFAGYTKAQLDAIQKSIADALIAKTLVVESSSSAYFKQGVNDGQIPVDVQAFGSLVLKLRGDSRSTAVANAMNSKFFLSGRGFRPFTSAGAPDVAWSEGTIEASLALSRLGLSSSAADNAVYGIASTIHGSVTGPIGADRDFIDPSWGEYHTWPTSAAASWLLIRVSPEQMLFAR